MRIQYLLIDHSSAEGSLFYCLGIEIFFSLFAYYVFDASFIYTPKPSQVPGYGNMLIAPLSQ